MNRVFKILLFSSAFISLNSCSKSSNDPEPEPPLPPPVTAIPQVDNAVTAFMTKHNVPGVSVAITKNGKLVYTKGYGLSDKEAGTEVTTNSLFRIASVSKPVTGIAVMKLVEEGKISLDEKVFGTGAILGTQYGSQPYSSNLAQITVRHLLHHTAGAWPNDGTDPMFLNPNMNNDQLMTWTLTNRPVLNTPGTKYAYSNFGYFILGRIIEKKSGKSYAEYVKSAVLQPAGITAMDITGNTLADRKTNEVKYYGANNENPYAYNLSRTDSHGGWLASANDLVRLMVRVDGFPSKPDILSAQSVTQMVTAVPASQGYALGWLVNNSNNWWHVGSLPGTISLIVRTSNGYNWAVLANTRSRNADFTTDLDGLIWKAVNDPATNWPEKDLF